MKGLLAAVLVTIATLLGGCVDVAYVNVTNQVNTYSGTHDRNRPSRHESVFSCSSINGLHAYLDYGEGDRSCRLRNMTAARKIEWYKSYQFGRVDVYEFMEGGWYYYTFKEGSRRYRW